MIAAFQKNETLLADIQKSRFKTEGFRIWWLGQSGFLVQWQGKHLLFDPYLSDSLTKKYASTQKPHTRISEQAISPELLDFIDIVTSSHNHTDHLDAETLIPILRKKPEIAFVIPEANRAFVSERLKCEPNFPTGLNDKQLVTLKDFTFQGIPAAHNELERDEKGNCKFMGFVVTFGNYSIYHSGDTLWFEGLEEILKPFQIDIAFLPINGNLPERGVAGNLNAEEAARLGEMIGAKLVIPHHFDMFAFNTADPQDFVAFCKKYETPYRVLRIGEGCEIAKKP